MLAAGLTSVAGLSLAFAGDYLGELVDVPARPAAVLFLVAVALLNLRGISESLRANLVMTVVEVGGLLVVVALGFAVLARGDGSPGRVLELPPGTGAAAAVLGGALIASYSFVGFETSANVAEEMRRPARDYPRALLGGLLAAGVVYVLVALTVSAAVPTDRLVSSSGPLLEVVRVADVGLPVSVFSLVALVALVAVANGALLTSIVTSRLTYGMAADGLVPSAVGRLLPGRRTPVVAIVVPTAASAALALTGELGTLAETVVLLLLVVFISTNGAAIVLRRDAVEHDHFTAPRVVPWLGLLSCVALLTQQSAGVYLRAALLLAVGAALYALTRLVRRRPTSG